MVAVISAASAAKSDTFIRRAVRVRSPCSVQPSRALFVKRLPLAVRVSRPAGKEVESTFITTLSSPSHLSHCLVHVPPCTHSQSEPQLSALPWSVTTSAFRIRTDRWCCHNPAATLAVVRIWACPAPSRRHYRTFFESRPSTSPSVGTNRHPPSWDGIGPHALFPGPEPLSPLGEDRTRTRTRQSGAHHGSREGAGVLSEFSWPSSRRGDS